MSAAHEAVILDAVSEIGVEYLAQATSLQHGNKLHKKQGIIGYQLIFLKSSFITYNPSVITV